jgi:hypothetical protein
LESQIAEISLEPKPQIRQKRRRDPEAELIFSEEESKEEKINEDQQSQRNMIMAVQSNRQSLAKMSKAKQSTACAICLEDIKPEIKATIDSCSHTYCFDCIQTWVTDGENSCPQCKKNIS